MPIQKKTIFICMVTTIIICSLTMINATAGVVQYSNTCIGFSNCDDSAFVAAAGGALTFNDFDIGGSQGTVSGSSFSSDFILSSGFSSANGGSDSASVMYSGGGSTSEVGPASAWNGLLIIDFSNPVSAVGFGTVDFGTSGQIDLYGTSGLLASFNGVSPSIFNYEGFVATNGDLITSVQLDDGFYAIQNMKYATSETSEYSRVPEPASLIFLGIGLGAVGFASYRSRKR